MNVLVGFWAGLFFGFGGVWMAIETYRVIRSARRTLAVQITADGQVLVRSPYFVSNRQIANFVKSKEVWIEKHLQKEKEPVNKLTQGQQQALKNCAKREIPERVAYYASLLGVTYGRITIRHQKTRWGSCSAKGNLNFNCLLMLAPSRVLDYVVIHELCHRKEMNHSPAFWVLVERFCPDYRQSRKWLKENGVGLMARIP